MTVHLFLLFIGCLKEKPKFLILRLRDFESFGLKFRLANNTSLSDLILFFFSLPTTKYIQKINTNIV